MTELDPTEGPRPNDVFAHIFSHDPSLRPPMEGGADALDHFLATIIKFDNPDLFDGGEIIDNLEDFEFPDGELWDGSWLHARSEGRDPRPMFAEAERCFIGNAIVQAPTVFTGVPNGRDDIDFVIETYGVPKDVVEWIYYGVVAMSFGDACRYATATVRAKQHDRPFPLPSIFTFDEDSDSSVLQHAAGEVEYTDDLTECQP